MSHFYGVLNGSAGQATRCGSKNSGMLTQAASWAGAIECVVYRDQSDGKDHFTVREIPWQGCGQRRHIASGIIGEA